MVNVLPPIALSETLRFLLLTLTSVGYTQSRKGIECPLCHCRYLLLMDEVVCPAESERRQAMEQLALQYFREQVRFEHARGHQHGQITMPVRGNLLAS
jgi:hypothetical protein